VSQQAGRLRRASDLGADGKDDTGIQVHGSPPSQASALQALEPTLAFQDGQPHRIPTMFDDQTVSTTIVFYFASLQFQPE
jgi:hypothetical protein